MNKLDKILLGEIEDFRQKGHKFLNGEISLMEFKHSSGGFGVYAHRGGKEFAIRLKIASGVLNKRDLKYIYEWAKKYNLESIHLTTRQAIQLHGISIDDACEIMKDGISKKIYTRGAGGDFPRNVAVSPLSGVEEKEAFDVTPYAIAAGNFFLEKIYTYKLPRKLKVGFSNNTDDEAHCSVQDLGFLAVNENGKESFTVYSGGALGRNPNKSIVIAKDVNPNDVLYYLEAMTNMFIEEGDYKNRNKARVRFILDRMGEEEYIKCYNKHLEAVKAKGGLDIEVNKTCISKAGSHTSIEDSRLIPQKQDGLYSVYFHPIGGIFKLEDVKLLLDTIENMNDVQMRLTMNESIYITNLNGEEAEEVLRITSGKGGETTAEQSVSCIGVPICQIGLLESQGTLHDFVSVIKDKKLREGALPKVYFSGCGNACGVHQIGEIGFTGKMKRVDNQVRKVFEMHFGGNCEINNTKLGEYIADIPKEDVSSLLLEIGEVVAKTDLNFHDWVNLNYDEFKTIIDKYSI